MTEEKSTLTLTNQKAGVPAPHVRFAMLALSLSMLLSSLGTSIANVALPSLEQAFQASFQSVQWVVLAYLLAITTLIVSAGRLGDLFGRKRLLLAGIATFTVASVVCGLAPSLFVLIAARAGQGLGAAIMMSLTMAFVGETVPRNRTGSAMGLLGTMSAIGTALGPSLGGTLIAMSGWQAVFLVNVPLGVAALFLGSMALPQDRTNRSAPASAFDASGTILLVMTLAAYALALTSGRGSFGWFNIGLILLSLASLFGFILVERRVSSPLVQLSLFRDPALRASLIMSVLVSTVIMSTLVVAPFYLSRALGLSQALVGSVMSVGPVVSAITGFIAGRIVDRAGATVVVVAGLAQMAAGTLALVFLPSLFGVWGYVAAMIILTPGYQMFQSANNTAVMMDVRADQRGLVSGLLNLSRNLGLITGASLMGAIFALGTGAETLSVAGPDATSHGMQVTFAVAAAMLLVGVVIAAARLRAEKPGELR